MSLSIHEPHYYLRSQSDKHSKHTQLTQTSPSPTTPPMDIINNNNDLQTSNSCTTNTKKRRSKNRRKRRFSQLNNNNNHNHNHKTDENENQDIDLNINTCTNKKAKLSRTIKFTLQNASINNIPTTNNNNNITKTKKRKIKRFRLTFNNKNNNKQNLYPVLSREISLSPNSDIITNAKRRRTRTRTPRIEEYELITHKIHRRNPFVCCYSFFSGFECGIKSTLGAGADLRDAIKILSQELVSGRAKASIQTQKNACLVYIKTRKNKLIGCSILHIDHVWKRVNIEMFAVDFAWRGNGFASMMIYLIQYRMLFYNKYDLFVCAANDAIPFWSNKKYNFVYAHKGILEQHEVEDEKKGGTKHLIWYGTPIQARCALLKCFKQSD